MGNGSEPTGYGGGVQMCGTRTHGSTEDPVEGFKILGHYPLGVMKEGGGGLLQKH
jgi:hypothetical protein